MVQPVYLLQIVDAEHPHQVVQMPGGGKLEREFVNACATAIVAKGVGLGRTEAHVERDVRDGIAEVIRDLKWETVRP